MPTVISFIAVFLIVVLLVNLVGKMLQKSVEMILMGWMRTIMINTAIDRLRKDNFLPEIGMINEGVWIEDKSQSADQSVLYKDLVQEVKKLPPTYRIVFNMYVIDGFTHQEIANQLKIAVGTSKSNLSKARGLLQSFIKKADETKTCYNINSLIIPENIPENNF